MILSKELRRMINIEDMEAMGKINSKIEEYEKHFEEDFPIFEYIDSPVTEKSYNKIKEIIDKAIRSNKAVYTPEDYYNRTY